MRRPKPFLRGYADQAAPFVKSLRDHHQALHAAEEAGDMEAVLAARGALSEAYRMLGRLAEAVAHGEAAVALARELERPKALVSNLIRLATARQYQHEHATAEPLFEEARALAEQTGFAHDFALQHHGKSLAEQGRWPEAIACFERALALREARGDAELVASSREALDAARAAYPG